MNLKKTALYLITTVLVAVLGYNFLLAPMMGQYNTRMGMGMGMHGRGYYSYGGSTISQFIVVLIIILAGIIVFAMFKQQDTSKRCVKCNHQIDNDQWKICPMCGTPVA